MIKHSVRFYNILYTPEVYTLQYLYKHNIMREIEFEKGLRRTDRPLAPIRAQKKINHRVANERA